MVEVPGFDSLARHDTESRKRLGSDGTKAKLSRPTRKMYADERN